MAEKLEKFDVHLFPVVRVKVSGVVAPDMKTAIDQAERSIDLNNMFTRIGGGGVDVEYADDMDGFLVDVQGDKEYRRSRWFTKQGNPVRFRARMRKKSTKQQSGGAGLGRVR